MMQESEQQKSHRLVFRGEEISRGEEIPRQKWYEETERLYSLLRRELQLDA